MDDSTKSFEAGDRRRLWCSLSAANRKSLQTSSGTITSPVDGTRAKSTAENPHDDGWASAAVRTFPVRDRCTRKGRDPHGRDPNFSRLQVTASGANPEKPGTARTIRNDGFPGSFGWTNAANQA